MAIVIMIMFMILSWGASYRLKRKFKRYAAQPLSARMSGKEVAQKMLVDHHIHDVSVLSTPGSLTDHYNPLNKTVNLSPQVYQERSIAAAAIAAHECGHAVQHAQAYAMLTLRSKLVPLQNISARVMNIVFISMFLGAFALPSMISFHSALFVIVACYGIFTLFALITLPVEFDASRRALLWVKGTKIATHKEQYMAKDALQAAAMTYVIAALGSLSMLLYYLSLMLGSRE